MKVLIVNPILYTSETAEVKKVNSIKDTMIYDLCLAFIDIGVDISLAASNEFKPLNDEEYPFNIFWMETEKQNLFPANKLPYCPSIKKIVKENDFDFVITSEVFSLNSLMLTRAAKGKLIVWHELAKHNNMMHGKASKFWYSKIAKHAFKNVPIVARSKEAKKFISEYCQNVREEIIDHGVDIKKFAIQREKENQFAVSSQLIPRKHIENTIAIFKDYLIEYDKEALLYIMGDGEDKDKLIELTKKLRMDENVIFTGNLPHDELIQILKASKAMLVSTEKDNNMVSIVESIAVGTPVITTSVPYNASYIKSNDLGIVNDNWSAKHINKINNPKYVENCINYRNEISTITKAKTFVKIANDLGIVEN